MHSTNPSNNTPSQRLQFPDRSLFSEVNSPPLPEWFENLKGVRRAKLVENKEWKEEKWRKEEGGFSGYDFCHSAFASVRILEYVLLPPSSLLRPPFPLLVGAVYFSERAESHRGLCHGGSMCAIMDDAIGWCGFCSSVRAVGGSDDLTSVREEDFVISPWNGFTVQVNTAMQKSVRVGSILRLEARVTRKEGARKHWIEAKLIDPIGGEIYCTGEGLFLLNKEEIQE